MPDGDLGKITPAHIRQADQNLTEGPAPPKWRWVTWLLLHSAALTLLGLMTGRAFQHGDPAAGFIGVAVMCALVVAWLLEELKRPTDREPQ